MSGLCLTAHPRVRLAAVLCLVLFAYGTGCSGTLEAEPVEELDKGEAIAEKAFGDGSPEAETQSAELQPDPDECRPHGYRYNCKPPVDHRDRPRIRNPYTNSLRWPLTAATPLMDGYGNTRGWVADGSVRINYGMRKTLHGQPVVYAWAVRLNNGVYASGWVFENALRHARTLRRRMPTIELPNPHRGHYVTLWQITGGNNALYDRYKVTKGYDGGGHEATDYLLRPGNVVNLVYNIPGLGLGGYSVDTVPSGTLFLRARGVEQMKVPLYYPGGTHVVEHLHFVYGFIWDGTQKRYGWIPKEAMKSLGEMSYGHCGIRCGDGYLKNLAAVNALDCRDAYNWCAGRGRVQRMSFNGQYIYRKPESSRNCCALCNNRERFHRVEGVSSGCTDAARRYCDKGTRGGLRDADWRSCQP